MKNPVHPGRIVRLDCLEPLGLDVAEASRVLGMSCEDLQAVLVEKAGITPEMAGRLSTAFGSSPETWLKMQAAFDLSSF